MDIANTLICDRNELQSTRRGTWIHLVIRDTLNDFHLIIYQPSRPTLYILTSIPRILGLANLFDILMFPHALIINEKPDHPTGFEVVSTQDCIFCD